jgi:hypothetical protein
MQKTIAIMRLSCAAIAFLLMLFGIEGCAQSLNVLKSSSVQATQQTGKPVAAPGGPKDSSAATTAEPVPQWLQMTKVVVEVMAYVLAFLFFLYKGYVGYLFDNLSLSLSCRRRCTDAQQNEQAGKDQIVVVVTIKKGENGMLKLFLLESRVVELKSGLEHTASLLPTSDPLACA